MAVAKMYGKPLVAVVPPESHYQQGAVSLRGLSASRESGRFVRVTAR